MKTALIIYVIYESVFFKNAHSSLDFEVFETMEQCEIMKKEAVDIIKKNTQRIDKLVAKCKSIN